MLHIWDERENHDSNKKTHESENLTAGSSNHEEWDDARREAEKLLRKMNGMEEPIL